MTQPIFTYQVSASSVEELHFDLPDFDSITVNLPSGLYTTFRTYAGRTKVIGLGKHLERLYAPAKAEEVVPAIPRQADLRGLLGNLLARDSEQEARIRLILDMSKNPGEIYILIQKLRALPAEVYREGVRVDISATSREKPSLKQTQFINISSFERKRLSRELFEILLTQNGRILEGLTSNFFYVRESILATAARGVLAGVTRQTVISIARQAGITVRYKALPVQEIPEIEEAFLTSSSRGVVPVVQIADGPIGQGTVGEVTTQLVRLYDQKVAVLAEPIA
jgi:branched-chain amino acid aminotransferase